jgi:hypothetical protein
MRKPLIEHLQNLPEEYREEAIRLHKESGWANDEFEFKSDALVNAFPFLEQKWCDLFNCLVDEEEIKRYEFELKHQGL